MDTSETYVKMCNCPEIQGKWNPKSGDLFFDPEMHKNAKIIHSYVPDLSFDLKAKAYGYVSEGVFICDSCSIEHDMDTFGKFYPQDDVIFLPRQDQIQEMIGIDAIVESLVAFNDFFMTNTWTISKTRQQKQAPWTQEKGKRICGFVSHEQLWLALYMHEKHNKIWEGEKWIATE